MDKEGTVGKGVVESWSSREVHVMCHVVGECVVCSPYVEVLNDVFEVHNFLFEAGVLYLGLGALYLECVLI